MAEFVAEICSNHNNDIERALALIDKAAAIGCAGVKFQLFRLDELFAPEVLHHPDYGFVRERREWELPLDWLPVIAERCYNLDIDFICTPFYLDAVEQLLPFVQRFKISSYELLWTDLLRLVGQTEKPVILSTGMASPYEIREATKTLRDAGCQDLTVLHCVSNYPAKPFECGIAPYHQLKSICTPVKRLRFGWSDHSVNPIVIYEYVLSQGASMVEFHLDLDGKGREYSLGHCWLPSDIKKVMETCRVAGVVRHSLGYSQAEQDERLWRADPDDGLRPLKEMRIDL